MPRQVEDLFSCWRGLYGSPQSAAIWKIASSCFLWCLWREINDRSIEGQKMMVELRSLFFKTLYQWIVALHYLNLLCFQDFLLLLNLLCFQDFLARCMF
jgi:hypothetical protein